VSTDERERTRVVQGEGSEGMRRTAMQEKRKNHQIVNDNEKRGKKHQSSEEKRKKEP